MNLLHSAVLLASVFQTSKVSAQHTTARLWNDELLRAISRDFARPPIHARNLFHLSAAMYDAWAVYDSVAQPYLAGRTIGGYSSAMAAVPVPQDVEAARNTAISYAAYRLIRHRFLNSPGNALTFARIDFVMDSLGLDVAYTDQDPLLGGPAAVGNAIASDYIAFGLQDGANEAANYAYQHYLPVNASLYVEQPGNPTMFDPNRWQPLSLTVAIDQAGNPVPGTPRFIGPEWGDVQPFGMDDSHRDTYARDGFDWNVFLDPGPPALLDVEDPAGLESFYKWNHCMVNVWQSHLDPEDDVLWDISPAAKGNISTYPTDRAGYEAFYDYFEGGDPGTGHAVNPATGQAYAPQVVKRGDYTRALAEYWADGPQSVTPPGHWFDILHTVLDHPQFVRRWMGQGEVLDDLAYDVKAFMALGGAMHDAAIAAWSVKGYYDSSRPVSAIRYMAERGQCNDPLAPRYHPAGLPLIPGHIEQVLAGDPLAGPNNEHVGKVKLYTYRGPTYVTDPDTQVSGVGWILAENWWPYQRPTFVTPPFAGYVSGHSTYSRTAAEVLTAITGDAYFPGGMYTKVLPQNDYLVFEMGPSEGITLQWATYRDASDACSLSRIWGGIHPPMDDIPGRFMGMELGPIAVQRANAMVQAALPRVVEVAADQPVIDASDIGGVWSLTITYDRPMDGAVAPELLFPVDDPVQQGALSVGSATWTDDRRYVIGGEVLSGSFELRNILVQVQGAQDVGGTVQAAFVAERPMVIDTRVPQVLGVAVDAPLVSEATVALGFAVVVSYDEDCDALDTPVIALQAQGVPVAAFALDAGASGWSDARTYRAVYTVVDGDEEMPVIDLIVGNATDLVGNEQVAYSAAGFMALDTKRPVANLGSVTSALLNLGSIGSAAQRIELVFDEAMDTGVAPELSFANGTPVPGSLVLNAALSTWVDANTYRATYDVLNGSAEWPNLDLVVQTARDLAGNSLEAQVIPAVFSIDTERPGVAGSTAVPALVADVHAGPEGLVVTIEFDEAMDTGELPLVLPTDVVALGGSLVYSTTGSSWQDANTFLARFTVLDEGVEVPSVDLSVSYARDAAGNAMQTAVLLGVLAVDTRNPLLVGLQPQPAVVGDAQLGAGGFELVATFDEGMDPALAPVIVLEPVAPLAGPLAFNSMASDWTEADAYTAVFDVYAAPISVPAVTVVLSAARDAAGNVMQPVTMPDVFDVQLSGVGIAEEERSPGLSLFPNPLPSGAALVLRTTGISGNVSIELLDLQGRLVHVEQAVVTDGTLHHLRMPDPATGSYAVVVHAGELRTVSRLVVVAP